MNLLRSIVVDFISTNLTKICCCWFKPVHYITHCLSSWEFHSPMTLQPYLLASYQIRILPFFKFERKRRFALSDCRSRSHLLISSSPYAWWRFCLVGCSKVRSHVPLTLTLRSSASFIPSFEKPKGLLVFVWIPGTNALPILQRCYTDNEAVNHLMILIGNLCNLHILHNLRYDFLA